MLQGGVDRNSGVTKITEESVVAGGSAGGGGGAGAGIMCYYARVWQ